MDESDIAYEDGGGEEWLAYSFEADSEGCAYFDEVIDFMCDSFGVSEEEAVARVNVAYKGLRFTGYDILYHNAPADTAKSLMYETWNWWVDEKNAKLKPSPGIEPPE
ncbi:hypothetical protein ACFO5K_25325 [Nocardia halotolerans]|uniref:CdiI immunity protein domain-containing protein n=1 Tax=Nocardia halotolerans TaxID=1755878 RepID=A0ABV8VP23_9NOCA